MGTARGRRARSPTAAQPSRQILTREHCRKGAPEEMPETKTRTCAALPRPQSGRGGGGGVHRQEDTRQLQFRSARFLTQAPAGGPGPAVLSGAAARGRAGRGCRPAAARSGVSGGSPSSSLILLVSRTPGPWSAQWVPSACLEACPPGSWAPFPLHCAAECPLGPQEAVSGGAGLAGRGSRMAGAVSVCPRLLTLPPLCRVEASSQSPPCPVWAGGIGDLLAGLCLG